MLLPLRRNTLQKRTDKLLWALGVTFVLFYLVGHALTGERGLFVLLKEQKRLESLQKELEAVSAGRRTLEHKTQMLGNGSLDLDLLDEQARRYLGKADKDEMVIPLSTPKSITP